MEDPPKVQRGSRDRKLRVTRTLDGPQDVLELALTARTVGAEGNHGVQGSLSW